MKYLILLFTAFNFVACAPKVVENPAAHAPTYTDEEFAKDSKEIVDDMQTQKSTASEESLKAQDTRLENYKKKYHGVFRVRAKDDSEKLVTLSEVMKQNLLLSKSTVAAAQKKIAARKTSTAAANAAATTSTGTNSAESAAL